MLRLVFFIGDLMQILTIKVKESTTKNKSFRFMLILQLANVVSYYCLQSLQDFLDGFHCFFSVQLGVNIFLALIVGAIFYGVKDDQSGIQNR